LDLAGRSLEMHEQLKRDILAVKHEIQVAEESQVKLKKWEVESIRQGRMTDPFVGYIRQIIINSFRIKSESSSIVIIIWRMYPTNGSVTGVLRRLLNISAP
jgi:hypothetical protein